MISDLIPYRSEMRAHVCQLPLQGWLHSTCVLCLLFLPPRSGLVVKAMKGQLPFSEHPKEKLLSNDFSATGHLLSSAPIQKPISVHVNDTVISNENKQASRLQFSFNLYLTEVCYVMIKKEILPWLFCEVEGKVPGIMRLTNRRVAEKSTVSRVSINNSPNSSQQRRCCCSVFI